MRSPPRRFALLSILAAAGLAGCTRDLALPEPPTSPVLTSVTPPSAYAGQLVRVTGLHLEPDPAANTLNFAHATARGERWEGGALVVRVPPDAGDGPVTASNGDGTSAPFGAFDYLGLGEPRRLQVAAKRPILHRPRGVFASGGVVVIESALYDGLVWGRSPALTTAPIECAASDADQGRLYLAIDDSAGPRLVALDAATGVELGSSDLPSVPHMLLVVKGTVLLSFHLDDLEQEVVAGWNLPDASAAFGPVTYGVPSFFGAADGGEGHAIVAGTVDEFSFDTTLYLLDVSAAPTAPAGAVAFTCDPARAGTACPPALGTASNLLVPVAGAGDNAMSRYAFAALDDGNVIVANLNASPPDFSGVVETYNPEPVEALAGSFENTTGAATKRDSGYVVGFSANGGLRWVVDGAAPTALARQTVPNPAGMGWLDRLFVANDGSNDVVVLDLFNGLEIGRLPFDVQPRASAGYAGGAAFLPGADGLDGDVIFPAEKFPALVRAPVGSGSQGAISRSAGIALVTASSEGRVVWSATDGEASTPATSSWLEGFLDYDDGAWTDYVRVELPSAPRRAAARGRQVLVATDAGLTLVNGDAPPAGIADAAPIPGAALSAPYFLGLGFTPTGDVWTLVWVDAGVEAQLWTPAAIAAGGTPYATWTDPGTSLGAAWLEDGLWVFSLDGDGASVATLLRGALVPSGMVAAAPRLADVHAVSPNGRLLVFREQGAALGYVLRFFRADPDTGFPEIGSLIFDERVEGFTFDASGERIFVLTQAPDRLITVD